MIAAVPLERCCTIVQLTPAWALGTGLRVALPPGTYRVTGDDRVDGNRYLQLDDAYRIDTRKIENDSESQ